VRLGRSRKRPPPAVASPSKNETPRRSCGIKPALTVRATLADGAWKGVALIEACSKPCWLEFTLVPSPRVMLEPDGIETSKP